MQATWSSVEEYLVEKVGAADAALSEALRNSAASGLPAIQVAPNEGKLLMMLALLTGARRILEIGALGGYSAVWLARALPADGVLITLECNERHAAVARDNVARAGLSDRVEIRLGAALEILPILEREGRGPFDLIFIDADKQSNAEYFDWAIRLGRPGSVIVVDNVVRSGAVVDAETADESVRGVRRFLDRLATEPRVIATALQTVGSKGYDGFAIAILRGGGAG